MSTLSRIGLSAAFLVVGLALGEIIGDWKFGVAGFVMLFLFVWTDP